MSRQFQAELTHRFKLLLSQLPSDPERQAQVRERQERLHRTRRYLIELLQRGTPWFLIHFWSEALWNDAIVIGMPSSLVLSFWGEPVARDRGVLEGGMVELWTYNLHHSHRLVALIKDSLVARVCIQ